RGEPLPPSKESMMSQLRGGATAPPSPFSLLPLRTGVLFPGTVITLPVGRKRSVALVETVHPGDVVGVVTQKDPKVVDPDRSDVHDVGTFVRVAEIVRMPSGEYRLSLEGLNRFLLTGVEATGVFLRGEGAIADERNADTEEARMLAD